MLCNIFASMTASEETFPMIKNVSKDDPCNWSWYPKKEIYHYKQTQQLGQSQLSSAIFTCARLTILQLDTSYICLKSIHQSINQWCGVQHGKWKKWIVCTRELLTARKQSFVFNIRRITRGNLLRSSEIWWKYWEAYICITIRRVILELIFLRAC